MAFTEPEGELQTAAEIASARQAFLSEPPAILDPNEPAEVEIDEDALLDEALNKPPAATEGAPSGTEATAPAPAPTGPAADPYAAYGGQEAVRNAVAVQEALRTEQGLRALVANGLVELGYSVEQVREALAAQGAAPAAPAAEPDVFGDLEDDDLAQLTVAQTRDLLASVAEKAAAAAVAQTQQQLAPVQETIQAQQTAAVRSVTDAVVVELLGQIPSDPEELKAYQAQVDAIVARGGSYYDPSQWANPAHIREAVVRANAELNAESEARYQSYLAGKRRARTAAPPNTGGGAGGEGPLPEPKNLDEARKQARAAGFFG